MIFYFLFILGFSVNNWLHCCRIALTHGITLNARKPNARVEKGADCSTVQAECSNQQLGSKARIQGCRRGYTRVYAVYSYKGVIVYPYFIGNINPSNMHPFVTTALLDMWYIFILWYIYICFGTKARINKGPKTLHVLYIYIIIQTMKNLWMIFMI